MAEKKRQLNKSEEGTRELLVYIYRGGGEEEVSEDVIKVIVDSSVTEIAEETFKYCRKLKSVVLNEGLRKIGRHAFYACESVESLSLPSTVTDLI